MYWDVLDVNTSSIHPRRFANEFLVIILIYQAMKPTDNFCPSHAIVYRRLATSASPRHDIFLTKFSLKRDSAGENVSILSHHICKLIRDNNPAHTIHYLWLSLTCRFQARHAFPSYLDIDFDIEVFDFDIKVIFSKISRYRVLINFDIEVMNDFDIEVMTSISK